MVDAYAIIGDVSGLAEKMQSFFMQEVLSETHSVLKNIIREVCWYSQILSFFSMMWYTCARMNTLHCIPYNTSCTSVL